MESHHINKSSRLIYLFILKRQLCKQSLYRLGFVRLFMKYAIEAEQTISALGSYGHWSGYLGFCFRFVARAGEDTVAEVCWVAGTL